MDVSFFCFILNRKEVTVMITSIMCIFEGTKFKISLTKQLITISAHAVLLNEGQI